MAISDNQPSARFRSATEFPKTLDSLDERDAKHLYSEIRDCLIFTNRSRSQLVRRNEEHKQTTLKLRNDVARLQAAIHQLSAEKQQLTQSNQAIVTALETQIYAMSSHMDELSGAFEQIADIDDASWSLLAAPKRLVKFLKAVRSVVTWWRQDQDDNVGLVRIEQPLKLTGESGDDDRQNRPQMHSDPASINRSLLDNS